MPNYRRVYTSGGLYFFTVVTFGRRPFLTTDLARCCLRSVWQEIQKKHPFQTEAVCLLPDHLHCIWRLPDGDADFSGRWNTIKSMFSKRYLSCGGTEAVRNASRQRKGESAIWQRRFWEHAIRDHEDFCRHLDYIHFNPVKHGQVLQPADWPWSSFQRYVRRGWYEEGWGKHEPEAIKGLASSRE